MRLLTLHLFHCPKVTFEAIVICGWHYFAFKKEIKNKRPYKSQSPVVSLPPLSSLLTPPTHRESGFRVADPSYWILISASGRVEGKPSSNHWCLRMFLSLRKNPTFYEHFHWLLTRAFRAVENFLDRFEKGKARKEMFSVGCVQPRRFLGLFLSHVSTLHSALL